MGLLPQVCYCFHVSEAVAEGFEEHVPEREISVVMRVVVELMMNAVGFGEIGQ